MKSKLSVLVALLINIGVFSQVTNEGQPLSWKLLNDSKSIAAITLPGFNVKALQKEDKVNDYLFDRPWRFGYMHNVDYGFESGHWTVLENGDRIWRIQFRSPEALSLNVIFDQFYMPEGGKVYLYNDDKSDLLGAYTSVQNQDSGVLGTWLVKGETLWIEYFEPKDVANQGKLHISNITHGYRNAKTYKQAKALNDSGDCNHDVDCPIGLDWENHKDNNKKAVGILLSGGSGFCSGALINNTNSDGTPYFLTANHCFNGNPAAWAFRFGWISPTPVCAGATTSTNGSTTMTISGATLRARNAGTDFCLVEINSAIPTAWDRTWAGWDKTVNTPAFVVSIHHPRGDIMKICRDDSGVIQNINNSAQTWEITTAGGGWELGVTEPGSSGAPLFDGSGRIKGQLFGGTAACSGINDNGQRDYYGRFDVSWDAGITPATRLKEWLDPAGTNPDTLDSFPPLVVFSLDAAVSVSIPKACGITEINPIIAIRNQGSTTLTNATIIWNLDGGPDNTIPYSGSLNQNDSEMIPLDPINVTEGLHTINVEITDPNTLTDENTANDVASSNITIDAGLVTTQIHLDLLTDNFAEETTWQFKDASGTALYSGGPYAQTADDNTHFFEDFDVSPNECYTFVINDSESDGICCDFGIGSYELTLDDTTVIFSGGSFNSIEETEINIGELLSVDSYLSDIVSVFPNPAQNVLTIRLTNTSEELTYSIVNVLGQKVEKGTLSNTLNDISLSNVTNGLYFVKIENISKNSHLIKKIIISK